MERNNKIALAAGGIAAAAVLLYLFKAATRDVFHSFLFLRDTSARRGNMQVLLRMPQRSKRGERPVTRKKTPGNPEEGKKKEKAVESEEK